MNGLGWALGFWLASAAVACLLWRSALGRTLALFGALAGCVSAVAAALLALASGAVLTWSVPWTLPGGAFGLRLDALAGVFLLLVGLIGGLCALYGWRYQQHHDAVDLRALSLSLYNVLLSSMALVVAANDLILLLIAWEAMTLSSWALVVSDHHDYNVRAAGLLYLAAAHIATAALVVFVLLLSAGGGFQIDAIPVARTASGALFVLAVLGFGTKAGVFPLHVWLPDAHPAAPSHVSALMSATMITMGFYGLARFLPIIGTPAAWWGYTLIVLGLAGALCGVLFALAQKDVKRILAYSTVENAGIITVAIGVGVLGSALHRPVLAAVGWLAAFLHLWNHALAKSALFLGFGAIAQAVGSRSLDAMGGLLPRWRLLAGALIVLCAAIAALPGLNLFTSEWLLLRGLISSGLQEDGLARVMLFAPFIGLAFAGALAVACFVRLVGIALLGNGRTAESARLTVPEWPMRAPIFFLTVACVGVALSPAVVARVLQPAVGVVAPAAEPALPAASLDRIGWLLPTLVAATILLLAVRQLFSLHRRVARAATWGCGYTAPSAAMQYTATSFSEPLTRVMHAALATEVSFDVQRVGTDVWPVHSAWRSRSNDRVLTSVYLRAADLIERLGVRIRVFQKPRVTTSLLYIVITVLLLLGLLFLPGAHK